MSKIYLTPSVQLKPNRKCSFMFHSNAKQCEIDLPLNSEIIYRSTSVVPICRTCAEGLVRQRRAEWTANGNGEPATADSPPKSLGRTEGSIPVEEFRRLVNRVEQLEKKLLAQDEIKKEINSINDDLRYLTTQIVNIQEELE